MGEEYFMLVLHSHSVDLKICFFRLQGSFSCTNAFRWSIWTSQKIYYGE